jgi:uncharacterized membrane protein
MQHGEQIPAIIEVVKQVAANVAVASVVGGLKVARPCIEPAREECAARTPERFAADQDGEAVAAPFFIG